MTNGSEEARSGWVVAAPFFNARDDRWLDDFITPAMGAHRWRFTKSPSPSRHVGWHGRKGRVAEWWRYWVHALRASRLAREEGGLITLFPQLALLACIQRRLFGGDHRIVAYCFNIGRPPGRLQRLLGTWAFAAADLFVVHSRAEIGLVGEWFDVPRDRIRYVPLQCGELGLRPAPDERAPYLLAMGSANRDYATLAKALAGLDLRAIIVAAPRCLEGIALPRHVECREGLSLEQCRELAARARINVVPLVDGPASSGQVTVVEAMRIGTPVIATSTIGTADYIIDGETGLLVPADNPQALADAIRRLWDSPALRADLARNAAHHAQAQLSDEAVAWKLAEVLAQVEALP